MASGAAWPIAIRPAVPASESAFAALFEVAVTVSGWLDSLGGPAVMLARLTVCGASSVWMKIGPSASSVGARPRKALKLSAGIWKDADHPELAQGSAAYVEQIRSEPDERFEDALRLNKGR